MSGNRIDKLAAAIERVDRVIPGPVYTASRQLYQRYLENSLLNAVRRRRDYGRLWVRSRVGEPPAELHLGCGREQTDMCDIDVIKTLATDYVLDARHLPFPDDSVERIESYHMVEHLPKDALRQMLVEWNRVLQPGGQLVMELPAFDDVVAEYLDTDDPERTETLLRYVFGSQRFDSDFHYWGWNKKRLSGLLENCGFTNISQEPATDNHAEEAPCMRIESMST